MKKFDVLKWVRQLRDEQRQQQQHMSVEEKLGKTKAEAERFRASRTEKIVPSTASGNKPS